MVGGLFLMAISGTVYLFPVYSEELGNVLGFSESQMQTIGTLINAGTWFGVVVGMYYDVAMDRLTGSVGPRLVAFTGAGFLVLGYGGVYMASIHAFRPHYLVVGMLGFLMGQGSSCTYVAALNTNCTNFKPEDRGKVVGILVCFFGLSAGVFALVYKAFFRGNVQGLMGCLAVAPAAVALAGGFVVNTQPPRRTPPRLVLDSDGAAVPAAPTAADEAETRAFTKRTRLALALVLLVICGVGASDLVGAVDTSVPVRPFAYVVFAVLLCFTLLPCGTTLASWAPKRRGLMAHSDTPAGAWDESTSVPESQRRLLDDPSASGTGGESLNSGVRFSGSVTVSGPTGKLSRVRDSSAAAVDSIGSGYGLTSGSGPSSSPKLVDSASTVIDMSVQESPLRQSVQQLDYWLLSFVFLVCIGASASTIDNLDRIVDSKSAQGVNHHSIKVGATSVFSIFNTLGRLLVGFLSDQFAHRVSRAAFLVLASLTMVVAMVWMAFTPVEAVYVGSLIQGLAHGGIFCVLPTMTSDFFGLANFGANWGLLGLAPAVGSELLGALMAPAFFKRACGSATAKCYANADAFRFTLLIYGGLSLMGVGASWWLKQRRLRQAPLSLRRGTGGSAESGKRTTSEVSMTASRMLAAMQADTDAADPTRSGMV